jgi:hypothetical protein
VVGNPPEWFEVNERVDLESRREDGSDLFPGLLELSIHGLRLGLPRLVVQALRLLLRLSLFGHSRSLHLRLRLRIALPGLLGVVGCSGVRSSRGGCCLLPTLAGELVLVLNLGEEAPLSGHQSSPSLFGKDAIGWQGRSGKCRPAH